MARENCPNCGADLPRKAKVCPEYGSDEKTGWSDDAQVGGLDLPDEEFNYDSFVEKEFGGEKAKPRNISALWWIVGILLVVALTIGLLRGFRF